MAPEVVNKVYCNYSNHVLLPMLTIFIDNGDSKISLKVRPTNVAVFAIVTHRLVAIYFTVCTRSRVPVQKYLLGTKFTNLKARSRYTNVE